MSSTSVVLLAYKEAENLKILLPKIHEQMKIIGDDYEILVIDSAQPLDDTKKVCEQLGDTLYSSGRTDIMLELFEQEFATPKKNVYRC